VHRRNDQARVIASRLAKYDVNMFRLHSLGDCWYPLIDYSSGTSQEFDADTLDRIDYFVSELNLTCLTTGGSAQPTASNAATSSRTIGKGR